MIQWWLPDDSHWLTDSYLAGRGKEIANRFVVSGYGALAGPVSLRARAHLFSGLDQLTAVERDAVAEVWDTLAERRPSVRLLNDPRRVHTRRALLTRLHAEGINQYRVFAAHDVELVDRFPVFVRSDRRHDGPLTGLLDSRAAIHRAIRSLRARGESLDDLMIVEHVDARDPDGFCRKYAAFRVGDHILPAHVLANGHWAVKSEGSERSLAMVREEAAFQSEGRYNDWIRRAFDIAGIDYGRIDFGVVRGQPQVWEINMHPTIGRGRASAAKPRPDDEISRALDEIRAAFHARLRSAFAALDDETIPEPEVLTISLGAQRAAAITARQRAVARRARVRALLMQVYSAAAIGRPLRWMFRRLVPRA